MQAFVRALGAQAGMKAGDVAELEAWAAAVEQRQQRAAEAAERLAAAVEKIAASLARVEEQLHG